MIRVIILHYLNIKPTHGYEIQQFISMSGIDQWTKIQSGSIYYALTKLEKEKNIAIQREERTGSRVRKIYAITEQGKNTLLAELRQEISAPLCSIGSAKFMITPFLSILPKDEVATLITAHLTKLRQTKEYWIKWQSIKNVDDKYNLTRLSFQMTIDSIEQQIIWHQELLAHLEYYMQNAKYMEQQISAFDMEKQKDMDIEERSE